MMNQPAATFTPAAADDIFDALLDAHRGLSRTESQALNQRLILALAAEVADAERVRTCIATAKLIPNDAI